MGCTQSKSVDEKQQPPAKQEKKVQEGTTAAVTNAESQRKSQEETANKNASSPATASPALEALPEAAPVEAAAKEGVDDEDEDAVVEAAAGGSTAIFTSSDVAAVVDGGVSKEEEDPQEAVVAPKEAVVTPNPTEDKGDEKKKLSLEVDDATLDATLNATMETIAASTTEESKFEDAIAATDDGSNSPFARNDPSRLSGGMDSLAAPPTPNKRAPRSPLAAARLRRASHVSGGHGGGQDYPSKNSSRRGSKSETDEGGGDVSKTQQKKRERLIKSGHVSSGRQGPSGRKSNLGANSAQPDVYLEMVSAYERQLTCAATLDAQLDTR